MFIKYEGQKIVNLDHVTSIGFIPGASKNKIVFNLDYSITLINSKKIIPDYVYWESSDEDEFEKMKALVISHEFIKDWVAPKSKKVRIVNPQKVSSIVYDENKNKIIFNLSHSVSFSGGLTSDFIFFMYDTEKEFLEQKEFIEGYLL